MNPKQNSPFRGCLLTWNAAKGGAGQTVLQSGRAYGNLVDANNKMVIVYTYRNPSCNSRELIDGLETPAIDESDSALKTAAKRQNLT